MKDNKKSENMLCAILYTIASVCFFIPGISTIIEEGFSKWNNITSLALGVTFGSLAVIYFQKYRKEK